MLLIALPNEHLMTFNQYKDAKTLFAAIQTRFGGNEATKKTQKTLLKQILPFAWNTHVMVWRNKLDLDIMSFDDLYKNFKIVEQEVKRTASSSLNSQNMAFVSSPRSTNEVNIDYSVSTANTQDLEQIHEDDLEEMNLKWQLALLSMRTRRFLQKIGRNITINGSDTARYDKSKVECFNCHKMGHFTRECRGPRNQDSMNRNQDNSRRTINMEQTSSKAMVAIDGAGFDWSYMADDKVPTNMALMNFSDSRVHNDKTCSKICVKSFETLKTQLDDLRIEFNKSEFNLATYKRGLASVEEQLVFYKKNEHEFEGYGPKSSKSVSEDISNEVRKTPNAPLVKELVLDDKLEKKIVFPIIFKIEFVRPKQQEKTVRKPLKYAEMYRPKAVNTTRPNSAVVNVIRANQVNAVKASACHLQKEDQGYVDSGCLRHMTGNMSYLSDFKEFDGGYVIFRGGAKVKELLKLFKLADESQVLLNVPRKNNMYSVDMNNIVPKECLTFLVANATLDESML
ncbi:ribonuclease H-like domain-containing protein [Tanacetum coccineum]